MIVQPLLKQSDHHKDGLNLDSLHLKLLSRKLRAPFPKPTETVQLPWPHFQVAGLRTLRAALHHLALQLPLQKQACFGVSFYW